jgi:valyl-tRNA synthetase
MEVRLRNSNFMAKAPKDVIQGVQARLQELKTKKSKTEESLRLIPR